MKYKKLFISCLIILFTSSCHQEQLKDITVKEKINDSKPIISEAVTPASPSFKEEERVTPEAPNHKDDQEIYKTEVTIESTAPQDDNSVDETNIDYPIHQGKIDCQDENSCMDLSLPIQFKYNELISNTFYLAVLAKNNQTLGYFIEYVFKTHQYDNHEECQTIGENIKKDLNNKITSYNCTDDNILTIITSY